MLNSAPSRGPGNTPFITVSEEIILSLSKRLWNICKTAQCYRLILCWLFFVGQDDGGKEAIKLDFMNSKMMRPLGDRNLKDEFNCKKLGDCSNHIRQQSKEVIKI